MQQHANIYRNKIHKIFFMKTELKKILLKSNFLDRNINTKYRSYFLFLLTNQKKKCSISIQKNVCLILSKHRSVYTVFNLKRHSIKKLNTFGEIPNLKSTGW